MSSGIIVALNNATMTFQEDGIVYVEVFNPKKQSEGFNGMGKYSVDFSKAPTYFDYKIEGRPAVQSIIEFVDDNTIAFEDVATLGERPSAFGSNRVVLKRQ